MARLLTSHGTGSGRQPSRVLALGLLAVLVGLLTGVVGACFRMALTAAEAFRGTVITWAHGQPYGMAIVIGACMTATAIAAFLVRRVVPEAAGSGIPHVEAQLEGEAKPAPLWLIPVKFVGGVLAIGSGLALGREGPSIQMAAGIANMIGRAFRRSISDCRELVAGAAGAGLATAFNAPLAGAVFVLEELVGRFEPRITVVALGASAAAIAVSRLIVGDHHDFIMPVLTSSRLEHIPIYCLLGIFIGVISIVYNRSLLATVAVTDRLNRVPELRAAVIGAGVGVVAWYAPHMVGGGDPITQQALLGVGTLALLPAFFMLRLVLGALSYSAGTPGGLLAPVLVLGAQAGLFAGLAVQALAPVLGIQPEAMAVVGMTAFFVGVVRAPLTGIALVTEMTGSTQLLLPMLAASFSAMAVPTMTGDAPVYTSLRKRVAAPDRSTPS
ncbi:H(+)/Cl(-) exchange transporter ClcA [Pseudoruegeria sp. SK021]|uniref:H(+)/Cl(-) exchange transporter ClcA n=1 Tax=Pseudoruegeria sp. SK021 TaxID=1933035 RepID=UPI000A2417EC|nr:H(+)/Cl(-) exchange transporter ClcA [Pseudoruegeria sp. SK021]OSP56671.1 chloride channel protein [Pseudoruegeria sp. SK021]